MQTIPPGFECVNCPACGAAQSEPALVGRDWSASEPEPRFAVVRCTGCGMHYQNPRPDADHIGGYYPADYAPHKSTPARSGRLRDLVLREAFGSPDHRPGGAARLLARAVMRIRGEHWAGSGVPWTGQGRLLDFGCGGGRFIQRLAALGWDVTGLDMSPAAVSAVRAAGLKAHLGTLPHPELCPRSFDVVTMRHALEHVPDPLAVLRAAADLLVPGGMLLVQVPNFAGWDVQCFGHAAMAVDLPRHLLHFDPASLSAMLQRGGLERVEVAQQSRPSWIRQAARRAGATWAGRVARTRFAASLLARRAARRQQGNELIATARSPAA